MKARKVKWVEKDPNWFMRMIGGFDLCAIKWRNSCFDWWCSYCRNGVRVSLGGKAQTMAIAKARAERAYARICRMLEVK